MVSSADINWRLSVKCGFRCADIHEREGHACTEFYSTSKFNLRPSLKYGFQWHIIRDTHSSLTTLMSNFITITDTFVADNRRQTDGKSTSVFTFAAYRTANILSGLPYISHMSEVL